MQMGFQTLTSNWIKLWVKYLKDGQVANSWKTATKNVDIKLSKCKKSQVNINWFIQNLEGYTPFQFSLAAWKDF